MSDYNILFRGCGFSRTTWEALRFGDTSFQLQILHFMDNLIIWFGTSRTSTIAFIVNFVTRNLHFFLHFLNLCGTTTDLIGPLTTGKYQILLTFFSTIQILGGRAFQSSPFFGFWKSHKQVPIKLIIVFALPNLSNHYMQPHWENVKSYLYYYFKMSSQHIIGAP